MESSLEIRNGITNELIIWLDLRDMPSFTVNICVLALVLLSFQQICLSRPHSRSKRSIVKDYFLPDPLVFSAEKFEKGEDGKYYLKKSAYKSDSEVKYEGENSAIALSEDTTAGEAAIISKDSAEQGESMKTETLKEKMTETLVVEEAPLKPTPPVVEEVKVVAETEIAKNKAAIEEKTETTKIDKEKAPFTPPDPKFVVPQKPDSKDEISLKTDLPPIDVDEKVDEKIFIGQVPHLYPRVIPVNGNSRLPVLIPVRKVSYGTVSVIPIPPMDGSDRLPLPYEDDIVGEGPHESEATDEISQPIEDKRKDSGFNPLMGIHLPFLSFRTFLNDFKDADKLEKEKQAKVVDVLGKKFLMQSSVMKHPTGDNSHMYVRFMSVKPLEEVKPEVSKEGATEKGIEQEKRVDSREMETKKEMEVKKEIEEKETEILKKEEVLKESEAEKEAEILKAEETEIKMEIDKEVPKEVVLENIGNTSMEKVDDPAIVVVSETKETKMLKAEDSLIESQETSTAMKSEEDSTATIEKTVTGDAEKKLDSVSKVEFEKEEKKVELGEKSDESDEVAASSNDDEMKIESADVMKKEETDKTMEVDSKKSFFMVEKNKKLKSKEESEEHKKSIKKSEKKKKKCKCEEKDSDSDDDDE